jgi:hypothetical protein
MDISTTFDSILNPEFRFILNYLNGKKNKTETFDQFVLALNKIDDHIVDFIESSSALSLSFNYVELIKKSNNSFRLKLTPEGENICKYISNNEQIVRQNVVIKSIKFIVLPIFLFLKMSRQSITKRNITMLAIAIGKAIVFLGALGALIVVVLQLIKYLGTGEI